MLDRVDSDAISANRRCVQASSPIIRDPVVVIAHKRQGV